MSTYRKAIGGGALAVGLTLGGAGFLAASASVPPTTNYAVNPSVSQAGTPSTAASTTASSTATTLGSAGAATTAATAATAAAATTTTAAGAAPATAQASTTAAVLAAGAELPVTGSDIGAPVKVAAGLGAVGLGALLIARRRKPATA